jgi:hypothetical protein
MNKSRVVGLVLLMVSMIGFAILSYSHVTSYLSQTGDHPVNFLTHFATVLAALLSTVAGFGISYFFFYKGKLAELNDFNFKACANYDVVIRELRNLKNPHVNNILLEYSGTIEAPELYVYDSFFLEFAALFAGCPKSERKRLINNLKTQIIPPKHYTKSTPCATPGCPGILELSMRKGEHYRVRCNDCNTVYACSVTKNDKIACRPIPGKHKRLTFTNFDNELGSYLTRIKALISKTDMALIAKKAVNMINNDPETT